MSLDFDGARLFNPYLTADHEAWRDQLRRFIDQELMPYADQWEEDHGVPDEIFPKAAEVGLFAVGYPEAYGGLTEGLDIWHGNIVYEELARLGCGGVSTALTVHGISLPTVLKLASEEIRQEVGPAVLSGEKRISLGVTEPGAGSDVANITTTAVRDGDHYVVNGSKTFITGGMTSSWASTAVRTGGPGVGGISLLLIPLDAEGVSRTPLDKKQGWWASDTATLYFDNVRVPVANLVGKENQGFKAIMNNFNLERMQLIVSMEANARVCLEDAVSWAQERLTFGKRLCDHQVIRHKIADMKQRLNATQAYIQVCSKQLMDGRPDAGDIAMLKVQASQTLEFCAREAMQILGGASYIRGNRIERIYREVRVNAIGGGSEEIMRDLAAKQYGL
ncbi:MAG: acyl-CoA dehydrogenase family protein [Candidatus Pelagadaptatus aseana]|uniref:acyl-CoA dehydrogenase family protein n=1 Tax=Candidatus Pelagadaptatus aseana TaxID=3120508 RepID=UPI0039B2AA98